MRFKLYDTGWGKEIVREAKNSILNHCQFYAGLDLAMRNCHSKTDQRTLATLPGLPILIGDAADLRVEVEDNSWCRWSPICAFRSGWSKKMWWSMCPSVTLFDRLKFALFEVICLGFFFLIQRVHCFFNFITMTSVIGKSFPRFPEFFLYTPQCPDIGIRGSCS